MSTINVQLRLRPETIAILDRMAADACARTPGASATRASVGAALLERAAREANEASVRQAMDPLPLHSPLDDPRSVIREHTDPERLRAALGEEPPGTADRRLDLPKGTTRNCLRGAVPLATAGGGKLLAWVETVERVLDPKARAK